jgi:hypothetical protein
VQTTAHKPSHYMYAHPAAALLLVTRIVSLEFRLCWGYQFFLVCAGHVSVKNHRDILNVKQATNCKRTYAKSVWT